MHEKMLLWGHCISQKCHFGLLIGLFALGYDLSAETGVHAWTYHYNISPNRNWNSAREWCRQHYTDMVAIQNQKEIAYLNKTLPKNKYYYWIGIRKIGGEWTWVGTNKTLTQEAENWANGEPNNKGQEDCVEIYIKRVQESGKWNDQSCRNKKGTLCYHASCSEESCSTQAECVETIGNYTCKCHPGFQGPRCQEAVTCGILKAPQHGSMQCAHAYGSFQFNSSCTLHCAQGFSLMGAPHLQCQASGHWDADPPSCQAVKCPELSSAPTRGRMKCTHAIGPDSFNSTCEFSCEEGFELNGPSSTWCNSSGSWSDAMPICEARRCDRQTAPPHGSLHCIHPYEGFSFSSSCNVSCEEGFLLNGTASTQCTSLGLWTEPPPHCQAQRCDTLTAPLHGSLDCFHPHEEFSFSSSCNVSCEEGFLLNGTASTLCTSLGVWTEPPPLCQARRCDVLTAPIHGSLHCSHPHKEFSFNSTCNMSCVEGFLLNGIASTQCTSLGVWTEPPPLCLARRCDTLTAPLHGSLHCSHPHEEFSFSSSCNVSCVEGFLLNGPDSTQCTSLGVWTEPRPLCQARGCDVLTAPLHGSLHCSHPHKEFSFNSTCNMSCVEGFLLNGAASTQCTSLGVWTEPPPLCLAQRCDTLTAPLHGSLHCFHLHEEFSFSSSCNVSCEEGFLLNGTASPQCTSLGVWTEPLPLCQARRCDVLTAPLHGSLHCSHPHKEFSFNSTCNMSCVEGFLLNGVASTQCTSLGVWTEPFPLCLARQCLPLLAPGRGQMNCSHPHSNFSFGSSCELGCEEGFVLRGAPTLQCTESGLWSHTVPSCQARRCDALTAPLHGSLHCFHPHEEFSFSSSCNVSCEEGFLLNGTASPQCASLGVWTEPLPLCQARGCDVLTAPLHGSLHCSHPHKEFSFNSTCNMSCVEGFLLNGVASTQCTSLGVWTEPPPLCLARQCLPLVVPGRGQINCSHPHSNFSFGSSCELGCEEGFVLSGAPTLQCTESGLWSHTVPSCQARQCNKLTAPLHGSLHCFNPHEEFSFSTSCNVSCEEGFLLNGTASTQCASLGVWTESPPLCQVVQCPALSDLLPPFLSMKCSNPLGIFSFRSQCFFHCGNGSSLNGTYKLSCTSNGMWTAPRPSCTEPEMTVGTGMMISTAVGFASAIALLLLGGLGFFIASHLSKRAARKDYLEARDIAIWEELENPAFEEEH